MKKRVQRTQEGVWVFIEITFGEGAAYGANSHRILCGEYDVNMVGGVMEPTASIWPLAYTRATPEQLRQHALELLVVTEMAEELQDEMRKIYNERWIGLEIQ